MRLLRLALWFGLAGAAWKTALIVGLRTTGWHPFFVLSVRTDPASTWLAEEGVKLFYDPRRLYPSQGEALLWEIFLALGFTVQCAVLGLAVGVIKRLSLRP